MKKKILIAFWVPPETLVGLGDDVEVIYPQEEVTGKFSLEELKSKLPEVDAVLIGGEVFDKAMIDLGTNLKAIGRNGVGCDAVDSEYAGSKGVAVINTPIAVTHPTAELSIAIMMDAARCVTFLDKKLRVDKKCVAPFSYQTNSAGLYGKTIGIVGFGRIGKAVGEKAKGLGMKVIYSDPITAPKEVEDALDAKKVSFDELLKTADFVSVHCPYVPENHHLINEKSLSMMKPTAYLVNASRGKMVDEQALVDALKNKVIKGAALDVYEFEPEINQGLLDLDNVVLVPHVGTWNYDARVEMAIEALTGIYAFLKGEKPPNIFNKEFLV